MYPNDGNKTHLDETCGRITDPHGLNSQFIVWVQFGLLQKVDAYRVGGHHRHDAHGRYNLNQVLHVGAQGWAIVDRNQTKDKMRN